jgi:hypothetical protein
MEGVDILTDIRSILKPIDIFYGPFDIFCDYLVYIWCMFCQEKSGNPV